ncbi:uncharacterized protein LOC133203056 isoform X3 [Saccostrea echinata]|uniref:uncharacterized protein LOC133203056 isoform X3 n=1 Tax=Saccostrea echinata TaxID=191078 RepID=UPI002A7EBE98|nr:uncharacterized protein LOC133203056 isoform X3 [Saccostrea echinata]
MSRAGAKEYDCLIIYDHARSRLASTEETELSLNIVKKADEHLTRWGYGRNNYHDRDCIPGRNVFTELFRVVDSSQFVLLILTEGFLKNCWVRYCQMAAFKKLIDESIRPECIASHRVIPISVNVPEDEVPQELRQLTCIYFVNDWETNEQEWLKLKRALDGPSMQETSQPNGDSTVPSLSQHIAQGVRESSSNPNIPPGISSRSDRTGGTTRSGSTSSINPPQLARVTPSSGSTASISSNGSNQNGFQSPTNGNTFCSTDSIDSNELFSSLRDSNPNSSTQRTTTLSETSLSQIGSNVPQHMPPLSQHPHPKHSVAMGDCVTLSVSTSLSVEPIVQPVQARLSESNRPITHTSSFMASDTSTDGPSSSNQDLHPGGDETSLKQTGMQFPGGLPSRLNSTDLEPDAQQSISPVVATVTPFKPSSQSMFSLASQSSTSMVSDSGVEEGSPLNGPEAESLSLNSFLADSTGQDEEFPSSVPENGNVNPTVRREEPDTTGTQSAEGPTTEREGRPSLLFQFIHLSLHALLQPDRPYKPL